jgi:hypothetical protein
MYSTVFAAGMQNCRFSSSLPRLYSSVFFVFYWSFYSGIAFQNSHIIIFEPLFSPYFFHHTNPSPTAALIVLSAVDDMEVDELDVTVLNEYRPLKFLKES